MARYEYQRLPGSQFIRILTLHPSQRYGDSLHCRLETALLDNTSDYRALSYCWSMNENGDVSQCHSISVKGRSLAVSRNLFEGLKRIRSATGSVRIWVDAICINQNDTEERNAQVTCMASIYSLARSVIVWLGEGATEEHDREAYEVLQHFHANNDKDTLANLHRTQRIKRVRLQNGWSVVAPSVMLSPCAVASARRSGNEILQNLTKSFIWKAIPTRSTVNQIHWSRRENCTCQGSGCVRCEAPVTLLSLIGKRDCFNDCIMVPRNRKLYSDLWRLCTSLISLLTRRYFSRRWIVQELQLAYHTIYRSHGDRTRYRYPNGSTA